MSLNRSRLLIAATAAAALGAFGVAPAFAAGMASSQGSMTSPHDHMSGNGMATHQSAKAQHTKPMKKAMPKTNSGGAMATQGGMK